ncbi:hypothetical protein MYSE111917_01035 [Mycobacterium senriense]|nr:hypothetical protein [Mycobacterium senriense]
MGGLNLAAPPELQRYAGTVSRIINSCNECQSVTQYRWNSPSPG